MGARRQSARQASQIPEKERERELQGDELHVLGLILFMYIYVLCKFILSHHRYSIILYNDPGFRGECCWTWMIKKETHLDHLAQPHHHWLINTSYTCNKMYYSSYSGKDLSVSRRQLLILLDHSTTHLIIAHVWQMSRE